MGKISEGYQRHKLPVIRWTNHGNVTYSVGNIDNNIVSICVLTDRT